MREPFAPEFYRWDELGEAARQAPSSVTVLIDLSAVSPPPEDAGELAPILQAAGMAPVLASVDLGSASEQQVRRLFQLGISDIMDARIENTPAAARALFAAVKARPLKLLMERSLSPFLSFDALTLIRAAAEVTVDGGGAEDLGEIFDARERTVSGWCVRESLPAPRRLLAWLRLILALSLLSDSRRRIMHAASAAGYTDHSLRRALRTFLGDARGTREWTAAHALDAFNAELATLRERTRTNAARGRRGSRRPWA